jgi:hypothetical protein
MIKSSAPSRAKSARPRANLLIVAGWATGIASVICAMAGLS